MSSAAQLKEQGTAHFRAGEFAAALEAYKAAAALVAAAADRFGECSFADESLLVALHGNRAACALKLGDGETALRYARAHQFPTEYGF